MIHGGDRYQKDIALDFSVNVNPLGPPASVSRVIREVTGILDRYPDPKYRELRGAIAKREGLKMNQVLCGNGASELFMAAVFAFRPKKVLLIAPSFYGYEHAAKAVGAEIVWYYLKEEKNYQIQRDYLDYLTEDIDLAFFCAPNNPTGGYPKDNMSLEIATRCEEKQIRMILDASFWDLAGRNFVKGVRYLRNPYIIAIKAFSKTYSVPGIRLGYAMCQDVEVIREMLKMLPEWNVSLLAERIGIALCKEDIYMTLSRDVIHVERQRMADELSDLGIRVFPSVTSFLLIKTEVLLFDELLARGILIRDCENFRGLGKGYYRIAIKGIEENTKLLNAIYEIFEEKNQA